jgi:hypothetical protein
MGFGLSVSPFFLRPSPYVADEPVTKGKVGAPGAGTNRFLSCFVQCWGN